MRKGTKLGIAGAVVVGVIAIAAITAATRGDSGAQVRLAPVARRDLVSIVSGTGWIRPHRKVDVQADIMGRIIDLQIEEGQSVHTGQVLLRIDPTQYEAAVERSRAVVSEAQAREAQAQASLLQAQRAYDRTSALATGDQSLVSRQALEEAETEVKVQTQLLKAARFGVAQAKASQNEAQDQLAKTIIRAPMDGVVTRLNVDQGETAIIGTMNNPGSLLLTVADMATMEAVVRVDETDVPSVQIDDSASLQIDAFPKDVFTGRVTEIAHSSVNPPDEQQMQQSGQGQAVDYEVVITLDHPPPSLRSDLSATADIVTGTRKDALSIPIIALTVREPGATRPIDQEDPGAKAAADSAARSARTDVEGVFVVRDGKAQFVPVTIGIAGREYFEVLDGLAEKDSVVSGPYEVIRSLQTGQAVTPMATTPQTGGTVPPVKAEGK